MHMKQIEHIGIAVRNLQEACEVYERLLGVAPYKTEEVASEGVLTAFFKSGPNKIELLQATTEQSAIAHFIEKKGEGIHHIAYAVDDVNEALADVEKAGVQLIDKQGRKGAEGLNIGFLHPKSTLGVLTELCDNK